MNIVKEARPVGASLEDDARMTRKLPDSLSITLRSYLNDPGRTKKNPILRSYLIIDFSSTSDEPFLLLLNLIKVFVTALWDKNVVWRTLGWSFPTKSIRWE
jgi:hypothetical protein